MNFIDVGIRMLGFSRSYFFIAIALFVVEVLIALFVRDRFVRPYLGDVVVVILIYCFVRSFVNLPMWKLAAGVLLFAFTIEFLQYVQIVDKLGLANNPIARVVIGTSFAYEDLMAYVAGIGVVIVTEKLVSKPAVA